MLLKSGETSALAIIETFTGKEGAVYKQSQMASHGRLILITLVFVVKPIILYIELVYKCFQMLCMHSITEHGDGYQFVMEQHKT